ncbi:hypothetical protein [Carnobacterium divergens]|uniref:Uncharacterized protein n=1 Tax=Carnobacterium divergens TaxID=2748 RepID=A0A7Z8G5H3_CARDV|nr:hypothetical protein [Carnobacterium divergens]TFI76582.1 hypothetical protein CKN58_00825 [Carnobacterium divergens]TFI80127.1 hypothetical protein CKN85_00825 [Carnobacterium divergens]TFI86405.1 hypothetical protein CKN56_00825 [Carnobacterium divergens]TFI99139.1 hypothetical protein CKN64_00825 [Carnobacterium divergens]TFJ15204.1 hypothetical protein CKN60_00820 [Carnobacterium divergens]
MIPTEKLIKALSILKYETNKDSINPSSTQNKYREGIKDGMEFVIEYIENNVLEDLENETK